MDFESMLMGVINSRLSKQVAKDSETSAREDRSVPDSTRRAFESRMKSDAKVARMAAQNMEDARSMVHVAQTGVTAIKAQFQKIQEILTQCAYTDDLSDDTLTDLQRTIGEHTAEIQRLAENTEFNGMHLLNGDNDTVVLQAGNSQRDQHFINLLDSSGGTVYDATNQTGGAASLDLHASTLNAAFDFTTNPPTDPALANLSPQQRAEKLLGAVNSYIERMQGLEAQYSYDIQSLDNLSLLFEEQADIYDATWERSAQKKATTTSESKAALLSELLASSASSILNGVS